MRLATISKTFKFHAAHRLPHHDGQCRDLHGHTYRLEIAVTGPVKDPNGDPDEGMVIDFAVIKQLYKQHIEPLVEHKFLNETLKDLVPTTLAPRDGDYQMPEPVTSAENIAWWIYALASHELPQVKYVRVRVWETDTSYAQVPPDPRGHAVA